MWRVHHHHHHRECEWVSEGVSECEWVREGVSECEWVCEWVSELSEWWVRDEWVSEGGREWVSVCVSEWGKWVNEWVSVSECVWVSKWESVCVCEWVEGTGGGRRRRRKADTELKTKTPHVNVGKKLVKFIRFIWNSSDELCEIRSMGWTSTTTNVKCKSYLWEKWHRFSPNGSGFCSGNTETKRESCFENLRNCNLSCPPCLLVKNWKIAGVGSQRTIPHFKDSHYLV